MGKTRLVHELIHQLPRETIVFAPSRNLGDRSDADLRHGTRYLGGKSCVLVFDDLNFYVGRTDVAELEQVVAEQASICSIAVTCTTSTLPQASAGQVFRAQLILHDKVLEVFESSLRLARESGYLKRRSMKVALDTTNILGRGAVKDTYNLLADGSVKLLWALAAVEKSSRRRGNAGGR